MKSTTVSQVTFCDNFSISLLLEQRGLAAVFFSKKTNSEVKYTFLWFLSVLFLSHSEKKMQRNTLKSTIWVFKNSIWVKSGALYTANEKRVNNNKDLFRRFCCVTLGEKMIKSTHWLGVLLKDSLLWVFNVTIWFSKSALRAEPEHIQGRKPFSFLMDKEWKLLKICFFILFKCSVIKIRVYQKASCGFSIKKINWPDLFVSTPCHGLLAERWNFPIL